MGSVPAGWDALPAAAVEGYKIAQNAYGKAVLVNAQHRELEAVIEATAAI